MTLLFLSPNHLIFFVIYIFVFVLFRRAVPACDGENHEGVLVRQWSSQTHSPAHQEDPVPAQRGGGCQDVSGKRRAGDAQPDHTP